MPDAHRVHQAVIITVSIIVILLESTTVVLELWAASGIQVRMTSYGP